MSGRTSALLAVLFLAGCTAAKGPAGPPVQAVPPRAAGAFSAAVSCAIALGDRTFAAQGGCAVDPGRGTRVELRNPLGMTALLVLLTPTRGALIAPEAGLAYVWTDSSRELPFSPADLLALFDAPPPNARAAKAPSPAWRAFRWKGSAGRIRAEYAPAAGPIAAAEAALLGPSGSRITVRFENPKLNTFEPEIFLVPQGIPLRAASPSEILREVTP